MKRVIGLMVCLVMLTAGAAAQRFQMKRGGQVLAHSLRFDPSETDERMPEALKELLRAYETRPRYAQRSKGKAVAPLMRTIRHQGAPFNRMCPHYTSDGVVSQEPCVVGCVATSLEQAITYYRYPEVTLDTLHGWTTDNYTIEDVLPGARIDWNNIRNDYRLGYTDEEAEAVARLSLYCGMAVHMSWGQYSSSASLGRAREPLYDVFGYRTVVYLSRALYSTPKWNALLRNELENGRPVCYTGHNMELLGHAFNIDGVDEEGYYHVLWGENGNWDGYFDLDYMNPYETLGDASGVGQQEGLFCNHTAMFMHPDDVVIDIADSLSHEDAFAGVTVDEIKFRRQPDTSGFTIADFTMTNHTNDSLNFTFEVLTYLPTDTLIFLQADYVGLSAVNLAPGETQTWPVYCQFSEAGKRIFSFSADDETLPFKMEIDIAEGVSPQLEWGSITHKLTQYEDGIAADLEFDVTNLTATGYAANLVTFILAEEGSSIDQRHWQVMSIPAGETQRMAVRFTQLSDGVNYHLTVRSPWTIVGEYDFTVDASQAADGIKEIENGKLMIDNCLIYDLSGRAVSRPIRGIYIKHGKKLLIP